MDCDKPVSERTVTELVDRYYQMVYRFAYRLCSSAVDAEDLTQETFLIAQSKLDQLREWEHAGTWLCAICRNLWLKMLSRRQADPAALEQQLEPAQEFELDGRFVGEELQQVLNTLPEDFRATLILFYFREFSYKQIAKILEIPLGTVMSRLARGRQMLREKLTTKEPV